jgi:hypothetical protein
MESINDSHMKIKKTMTDVDQISDMIYLKHINITQQLAEINKIHNNTISKYYSIVNTAYSNK